MLRKYHAHPPKSNVDFGSFPLIAESNVPPRMHLSSAPMVTAPTEVIFQPKILHDIAIFSTAMQFSYLNMVLACTKVVRNFFVKYSTLVNFLNRISS